MGRNRHNFNKTKSLRHSLPSRPPCPLPPSASSGPLPLSILALPEGVDRRTLYICWTISNPWLYSLTWRLCLSLVREINQRCLRISLEYSITIHRNLVCGQQRRKESEQIALATDTTRRASRRDLGATADDRDASRENESLSITAEEDDQKSVLDMLFDNLIDAPSIDSRDCFFSATDEPPITRQSLRELDTGPIINNVSLRHDINFDRDLHIRPILDGDRFLKKREMQKAYWIAVEVELYLYKVFYGNTKLDMLPRHVDVRKLRIQRRLPLMFRTIKEIIINLVPKRDQAIVQRDLDVPLLMQEIEKELCDFVAIAQAIASLLKRHCAPMRDDMVDGVVRKMQQGDPSSISAGLRDLFGVLEAMKLDLANHQIRNHRGLLIRDTIEFEVKHHLNRIDRRRIGDIPARAWFLQHREEVASNTTTTTCDRGLRAKEVASDTTTTTTCDRGLRAIITGLVSFLLPNSSEELPETFALDTRRLRTLKAELDEFQFLSICCDVFVKLASARGVMMLLPSQACEPLLRDLQDMLRAWPLPGLPNTPMTRSHVSIQIARQAARYCGKSQEPDSNLIDQAEILLNHLLESAGRKDTGSKNYAKELKDELVESVLHAIQDGRYLKMSTWELFNALVPTSTTPNNPNALASTQPQLTIRKRDIVRRITHIGVLHWRIWAPIVYLNENVRTEEKMRDEPTGYPDNSLIATPTPVAAGAGQQLLATASQDAAVTAGTNLQRQPSPPALDP